MAGSTPQIDAQGRQELLALARQTLETYLESRAMPTHTTSRPELLEHCGAFVSLHAGPNLRGCIGRIVSDESLYRTVQQCAVSAAVEDYRFDPVTREELGDLTIEISVLTPIRRVAEVDEIEVGRHGLYVTRGIRHGLLLPQVATENGWDRETFLCHTCAKAGLPEDAWFQTGTVIHSFEAQVFSEPAGGPGGQGRTTMSPT
jgi:AmmeMemoRadiSam system protein A